MKDWKDEKLREMFAYALSTYRIKHDLSKLALARKIGVSHNQIYRWESKKSMPSKLAVAAFLRHGILQANNE